MGFRIYKKDLSHMRDLKSEKVRPSWPSTILGTRHSFSLEKWGYQNKAEFYLTVHFMNLGELQSLSGYQD